MTDHASLITLARKDVAKLHKDSTVQQALDHIREKKGIGDRIIYFYVVDDDRVVGVVPTRRLLASRLEQRISEVMIGPVITIPEHATVLEAYEFFVMHKLLAFPAVDKRKHILGVVDIGMFTDEAFDLADQTSMDRVFERSAFVSCKCGTHRRCGRFAFGFHGCWPPSPAVRYAHKKRLYQVGAALRDRIGPQAYDRLSPRFHLPKGPAKKIIADLAAELQAILCSWGRSPAPDFRADHRQYRRGNSEPLECSVLAIKPPGFSTLVKLSG